MKILISTHHQEENNKDATTACSSLPIIPKTILPHYIILNKTVSRLKPLLLTFFFLTSFLNAQGITDGGQIASDERA